MKSLRFLALLVAVGAVCVFPARVYGQQEVDPDHFDQSTVQSSKPHTAAKTSPVHHHSQRARLANRHAGSKSHHHSAPILS
jgi:hypothetical protein